MMVQRKEKTQKSQHMRDSDDTLGVAIMAQIIIKP